MKRYAFVMFFVLTTVSCDKPEDIDPKDEIENDAQVSIDTCYSDTCYTCNMNEAAQLIYDRFLQAYHDSCLSCFEDVLNEWSGNSIPATDIPDSLKKVYDVYKEFYSPWDLGRIGDPEIGTGFYTPYSFYIIQSAIVFGNNFRTFGNKEYVLNSFKPSVRNDTVCLLYLDDDYKAALYCFLGTDLVPVQYDGVYTPEFPGSELSKRYKFLSSYLRVLPGHWGDYWHLETHPEVISIEFNESEDSAMVFFRIGYEGGEAILGKAKDNWVIVDHYMTLIE